jgi:hypothetical protein
MPGEKPRTGAPHGGSRVLRSTAMLPAGVWLTGWLCLTALSSLREFGKNLLAQELANTCADSTQQSNSDR